MAPVVLRGFFQHRLLVGGELFVEQAGAVESMLAQHALAPGVDGVDGRVVHAFGRHCQTPGCGGAGRRLRVVGDQLGEQAVSLVRISLAPETARCLKQA